MRVGRGVASIDPNSDMRRSKVPLRSCAVTPSLKDLILTDCWLGVSEARPSSSSFTICRQLG